MPEPPVPELAAGNPGLTGEEPLRAPHACFQSFALQIEHGVGENLERVY